ncbi:MAG: molybdopterin biosynthesis protein [Planctomycetaceae bacterium]|nr:molybdopterin biosynthesis protein [Planctomycetaceae bacterium]
MQEQFLDVIDRDEAERRFHAVISREPVRVERVPLEKALGRVLSLDVVANVDVPSFERSNYDGFAVQAADTFGAQEETPRPLKMLDEVIAAAVVPSSEVTSGDAVSIATGGMVPRGADAVVMVEHTDSNGDELIVRRAVTPGFGIAFAGTDVSAGETVLRRGDLLTSRETGVLAAIGVNEVEVWARPRVGVLSTGDEIIHPGEAMRPGMVYDSNSRIIADAVRELGGEPIMLGIVHDDLDQLRDRVSNALAECDVVLLSGGTSKGASDLSYHVVSEFDDPGIVAHGVALKPGKPICLAASRGKPIVILPGFPTSAIFTFHEFVAPVIRALAGRSVESRDVVEAQMAVKVNSEIGRTEYLLVGLVEAANSVLSTQYPVPSTQYSALPTPHSPPLSAYPMGKGSGSVTTFSRADGFVTIGRHEEIVDAGQPVQVRLLGRDLRVADLVVIGSHCVGLDFLLGELQQQGFDTKFLAVGSTGGLEAARRSECDLAGIHLLDPETGEYNRPFLTDELELIPGYGRLQGIVYRTGDERFEARSAEEVVAAVKDNLSCMMVNRNKRSGTRILIDRLLAGSQPRGYAVQSRSHNAVAAAVGQGRADWGVAIQTVAEQAGLGFTPLVEEQYDFVIPGARRNRPAVAAFASLLADDAVRQKLTEMGFRRE